ncbi:MarR family winged helix-turn-helix transcriptional regulator [Micromonospora profundi]|uniref:MarR family winged helix-turn-helix transcriptional regulator n=1 Tax=Micromonospora profundi TaxID=1420889 RepID=A0AAJ6KY19_9ACTN|nr:MarR family winged helix-turn-helix transcriptional regulator [Micromonospora profundi]WLS44669.1 MarR family winged helix-turn-helix transcriptional regulator [Micromonospora profundi]
MPDAVDHCELAADRRRGSNFGWSLGMVLRRWHEHVEEALKDLPHGSRGYHILAVVVHEEVPTQGALAARLVIDRSVLTYVIDDLENAGLIERQLDPRDRRARRIVATERGRQALVDAERRVAYVEDHVLGGLPEDQRDAFRDFAERAAEAIHAAAPGTDPCVAVISVLPPAEQPAS